MPSSLAFFFFILFLFFLLLPLFLKTSPLFNCISQTLTFFPAKPPIAPSLAYSNFFHKSPESLPGGGDGWLFLKLRRIRTQPIKASLLRQRISSFAGSVDVTFDRGIPPDSSDVLCGHIRSGKGRESGHSKLPALRARPVRASGADTARASRRRHGSRVLLGHGVCNGYRKVARALRDRK